MSRGDRPHLSGPGLGGHGASVRSRHDAPDHCGASQAVGPGSDSRCSAKELELSDLQTTSRTVPEINGTNGKSTGGPVHVWFSGGHRPVPVDAGHPVLFAYRV